MTIKTTAGTKFYIGTTAAATDLTTFQTDTYSLVGEVESIGPIEDSAEEVKFTSLTDSRVQKVAGVRDAGTIEVSMGYDPDDAGQTALIAAFNANAGAPYNFKTELNDALTGGAGPHHGTQFFWKGVVLSQSFEAGSANEVVKLKMKISVTSDVVMGAAA
ncbi:hypothetical protein [Methylocystis sp. S23]